MKEAALSTTERLSVWNSLQKSARLDDRELLQVREVTINFGIDFGSCSVTLGETRVLAQVTCEVVEPNPARPNEGKLSIFVHLSPMAAPHYEVGRSANDFVDPLQQILDRNIKDSRCLDLESLCIMAEESVWHIRVDVTVLNNDGNLCDACNLAAVAALRHFHRPDVTVEEDGRVRVHTFAESAPVPTYMKKIPVCLTYAFFLRQEEDLSFMIMDPTYLEERVMSGELVVGLNPHGEVTSLVFPGRVSLQRHHIMNCIQNAFVRAKAIAHLVQMRVEEDLSKRSQVDKESRKGFVKCLRSDTELRQGNYLQMMKGTVMREDGPSALERMEAQQGEELEENCSVDAELAETVPEKVSLKTTRNVPKKVEKAKNTVVKTEFESDEEEDLKVNLTFKDYN